jgi:hypothetical protein
MVRFFPCTQHRARFQTTSAPSRQHCSPNVRRGASSRHDGYAEAVPSSAIREAPGASGTEIRADSRSDRQPERQKRRFGPQETDQRGACIDPIGYDAGKKIKGKKRYILIDMLGLLLHADAQTRLGFARSGPNGLADQPGRSARLRLGWQRWSASSPRQRAHRQAEATGVSAQWRATRPTTNSPPWPRPL